MIAQVAELDENNKVVNIEIVATDNFGVKDMPIQVYANGHYLYDTEIGLIVFQEGEDWRCSISQGVKVFEVSPNKGRFWLNVADALTDILGREVKAI